MNQNRGEFVNAHNEVVPYDGSEVTWRVSVQAIIEREGKILLMKDKRQSFWSTPGGGAEVKESLQEVMQREFLEAKFRDCVSFSAKAIPPENVERAIALIRDLERLDDASEITRALT